MPECSKPVQGGYRQLESEAWRPSTATANCKEVPALSNFSMTNHARGKCAADTRCPSILARASLLPSHLSRKADRCKRKTVRPAHEHIVFPPACSNSVHENDCRDSTQLASPLFHPSWQSVSAVHLPANNSHFAPFTSARAQESQHLFSIFCAPASDLHGAHQRHHVGLQQTRAPQSQSDRKRMPVGSARSRPAWPGVSRASRPSRRASVDQELKSLEPRQALLCPPSPQVGRTFKGQRLCDFERRPRKAQPAELMSLSRIQLNCRFAATPSSHG